MHEIQESASVVGEPPIPAINAGGNGWLFGVLIVIGVLIAAFIIHRVIHNAKHTGNKAIIAAGVIIIAVSSVFCIIGQSQLSAADKELKAYYAAQTGGNPVVNFMAESGYEEYRRLYYLPGEQMRDYAGYGIFAGAGLIGWSIFLIYQRQGDVHRKSQVKDLLDDYKPR